VNCSALEAEGDVTIAFLGEAEISVPIKGLAYRNGTECVTLVAPCYTDCGYGRNGISWGPPFLSNVYATFNPDNFTVAFSQLVDTNETRIEAI